MYKSTPGNNFFSITLAYVYCLMFMLVSYHYAFNLELKGDTHVYYMFFNNIVSNPFPWGMGFVTPCIMFLVKTIGGDFRFFLFICLVMWAPVIFYMAVSVKRNAILIFAFPFFLLPIFMGNVLYLIRQFHAALFFLIFVYFYYRERSSWLILVLLFLLSVGSHISAVMWFIFFNKKVCFYLVKPINLFVIVFISLVIFLMHIDAVSMLVNGLIWLSNVLEVTEIDRKLLFYTSGQSIDAESVKYPFILLSFNFIVLSVFLLIKRKDHVSFYLLVLIQSLSLIVLSDNTVAANRFGFFTFYFSVPLLLLLFSSCFKKIKVTF